MKKLYYVQFLFLVNIVFLNFGMQPLSPSCLLEAQKSIQESLNLLSPKEEQTPEEAYIDWMMIHAGKVYRSDEEERLAIKELRHAYKILKKYQLEKTPLKDIENSLSCLK